MIGSSLLVRTPSRLHFGLLGWGLDSSRQFGGVGLMIGSPAIELQVELAPSTTIQGPLADRAGRLLVILQERLAALGLPVRPLSMRIIGAPPEHVGLGVGTQLSLAIAAAVVRLAGEPMPSAEFLARLTGRGQRSGIGLHGFQRGGLIVDGGRKVDGDVPPLITRCHFPEEWSILVVLPPGNHGLHGQDEVRAFRELHPMGVRTTERLCRIVLLKLLPALLESDLTGFGAALEEIQIDVGDSFASAQGGPYSSPLAAGIIGTMHQLGFVGCGQSSWGPGLYGFTDRPRGEVCQVAERLRDRLGLHPSSVVVTSAANHGAQIEEFRSGHETVS